MNSPVYVDWAITHNCNLSCLHCVGMESAEITNTEAVRIAKNIVKMKPQWVILEGGEPLLRKDLSQIGRIFHDAGILTYIITNGNAFNDKNLQELASFSPRVLFSMDGADRDTYEYVKRGASFDKALKWIKRCNEVGIFYGFTSVLSKLTLRQVKDIIGFAESVGGQTVIFLPLKPFGDIESNTYYNENSLSPEEQRSALIDLYTDPADIEIFYDEPFLWNLSSKYGFKPSVTDNGITIPEVKGCAAAYSMYIQTDGSVRPCMFASPRLDFGNATKEKLSDIWRKMQTSAELTGWANQRLRIGKCAECKQFNTCRGCLARTTILTGNPLESDPCCPIAD